MLVSISFFLYLKCLCVQETGSPGKQKKRRRSNYNPGEGDKNVLCILRNTSHRCNDKVCNLASNSNHVNSSGRRDEKWKNVFMQVSRNQSCEQSQDSSVEFYGMTSLLYSCKKQSWQTNRCVSPANTSALFTLVYWRQIICKVTPSTISLEPTNKSLHAINLKKLFRRFVCLKAAVDCLIFRQ